MWLICCVMIALMSSSQSASRPPSIYTEPNNEVFFKEGESVEIPCEADGDPEPVCEWSKNGAAFDVIASDERIIQKSHSCTLIFQMPEEVDEGLYQCFAENDFGRSASKKVYLQMGRMGSFIMDQPTDHQATLGRPLTLPCVPPESVPPAAVFWVIKNLTGGISVPSYDFRVSMDTEHRLRITHVIEADAKKGLPYQCFAMNNILRKYVQGPLHYIKLSEEQELLQPVQYMWSDKDYTVALIGSNISLKCIFSGNPTPDVHWERADNQSMSDRVNTSAFDQRLLIINIQFEDAGDYRCWANNSVTSLPLFQTFSVEVQALPYFLQMPKDVVVAIGDKAELACYVTGVPEPSIEWLVNGVDLKDVSDPRINGLRFQRPKDNIVTLENVQPTDRMVFQCNASNIHGYIFANLRLDVRAEPPRIVTPPKPETEAAESQEVIVTCEMVGMPVPQVTWYKDGFPVTGQRFTILPNGSLLITLVVMEDAGHYKCHGQNRYNTTEASGQLIVRHQTLIVQFPSDLEVISGSPVIFTCIATTDPEKMGSLRILWKRSFSGYEMPLTDRMYGISIDNKSVFIAEAIPRDSGVFTCIATNGIDNVTASAILKVKDVPDPPRNVRWTSCGWSASIAWTPGTEYFSPTERYVLQYNSSFNPNHWTTQLEVNASFNQANLTLNPYVNYTFRVLAYSQLGASRPSEYTQTVCTTRPDRPRTHPQNLRTLGHKFGKLYIAWTPVVPILQSGPGFYYLLNILPVGAETSLMIFQPIDDWRIDHFEMSVANYYRPFRIMIRAINAFGEAAADPPTIIGYSYESTPVVAPFNLSVKDVNDTFAIFHWEFDKSEIGKQASKIRGEFKGFTVLLWVENQRELTIRRLDIDTDSVFNGTGNTFTASLDTWTPNKRMKAQIAVRNNYYSSVYTEDVSFTTLPGLPGSVEYIRPVNVVETEVTLEWTKPLEDTGVVEGYDITYRLLNGLQLGDLQNRDPQINDPTATNVTLSGLVPSSKYRISIYARSAKGRGEEYFVELVTAEPPRRPDPPLNLIWTQCNVTATLTWRPGNDNKSPILHYDLQYSINLDPNDWTFGSRMNASLQTVNVTVVPNVNYTFRVIAYNQVGVSDPSEATSDIGKCRSAVPSAQPQLLRTRGHKHGKLYIEWNTVPLSLQNGRDFYYYLHIQRLHGQPETEMVRKVELGYRNSLEMAVDYCYEPYRITIRAVNNIGESAAEPSSIIGYSYEDAPSVAPINFTVEEVGDTYVIFIWNFNKTEIGKYQTRINGEFKGFKVLIWEKITQGNITLEQDIGSEDLMNFTGNTFSARVDNLVANTTMQAKIAVVNNYYTGIPSQYVMFNTQLKFEPPAIATACQNITEARERQSVILVCDVTGNPRPTVRWYKNGVQTQGVRHNIVSNGTLVLTSATVDDSGEYGCEAENQLSSIKSAKCTVTVKRDKARNSGNRIKVNHSILAHLFLLCKAMGL